MVLALTDHGSAGTATSPAEVTFTPTADSLIVVIGSSEKDQNSAPTISGGGLTWTKQEEASVEDAGDGYNTRAIFWTAEAGSSPSEITVSMAWSGGDDYGHITVLDFTGYDTTTPIGAKGTATGGAVDPAASISVTLSAAPASSSYVLGLGCAEGTSEAVTITTGTLIDDIDTGPLGSASSYRTGSTSTTVSWDILTTFQYACAAIEIKESSLTFETEGFRFRNDDGSESAATWNENQDVDASVDAETNIRLRVLTDATGNPGSVTRTLQVKRDDEAASEWRDV